MKKVDLKFGPMAPDQPALADGHLTEAWGVIPAASGFRPLPSALAVGRALPERVTGAASWSYDPEMPGGPVLALAGTEAGVYQRTGNGWSNVLDTGGRAWDFAIYGDNVLAVNGVDAPFEASRSAALDFQPLDGAPAARRVAVVGNFVVLGRLAENPAAVRWSAIDDPLSWPAPGSTEAQVRQSDIQVFPDVGPVMALATGMSGFDGLVFCGQGIFRMQYVGPPFIFQFSPVDKGRGALAAGSVVQAENMVYWLAEDGFFGTDGGTVQPIGAEVVNAWFRRTVDPGRREETLGVYDPVSGVVVWAWASSSALPGLLDRLLLYHPRLRQFSLAETNLEYLYLNSGLGLSLEDLDRFGALDTLPFSLDAESLMNRVRLLSGFDQDHQPVIFAGPPQAASLTTEEKGGQRVFIHGVRPLVDGAEAEVSILYRDFQRGPCKAKPCGRASRLDGRHPVHLSTRYARVRVDIPAGAEWSTAIGAELFVDQEGGL
jgi:hypothetical protein